MEPGIVARRLRTSRNDAGSLLASTFIAAAGVGCVVFTMLAVAPADRPTVLTACGIASMTLLVVIILQRFQRSGSGTLTFISRLCRSYRDDGLACQYEPRKRSNRGCGMSGEGNRPISVDELREIQATSPNSWVPVRGNRVSNA